MSKGIRIKSENFSAISDALEKSGIDWSVWNAEAMMDPNYSGPIDLECHDNHRFGEFSRIVRSVEKRSQ
jgi:hypothetical protein